MTTPYSPQPPIRPEISATIRRSAPYIACALAGGLAIQLFNTVSDRDNTPPFIAHEFSCKSVTPIEGRDDIALAVETITAIEPGYLTLQSARETAEEHVLQNGCGSVEINKVAGAVLMCVQREDQSVDGRRYTLDCLVQLQDV
jgi:hypothetical protein